MNPVSTGKRDAKPKPRREQHSDRDRSLKDFAERFKLLLSLNGIDPSEQSRVGRELNVSRVTAASYVRGEGYPKVEVLRSLTEKTGASLDWLLTGQGTPIMKATEACAWDAIVALTTGRGAGGPSMEVVRNEGREHPGIQLMKVAMDDMEAAIGVGDIIVVNTQDTDIVENGIYLLRTPERELLRTVASRITGGFLLRATNAKYAVDYVEALPPASSAKPGAKLSVVGRVIFCVKSFVAT